MKGNTDATAEAFVKTNSLYVWPLERDWEGREYLNVWSEFLVAH